MKDFNLADQFKQLEVMFAEAEKERAKRAAAAIARPTVDVRGKPEASFEKVPWPPHMRFD
jgi:hypothetical protein